MEDLLNLSGNINSEIDALGMPREIESIAWCLSIDVCITGSGCDSTTICEVGCHPKF